jgi:hypothetical protein
MAMIWASLSMQTSLALDPHSNGHKDNRSRKIVRPNTHALGGARASFGRPRRLWHHEESGKKKKS